jgi:hypothetical protein
VCRLGHDDEIPLRDVVFFECLSEDTPLFFVIIDIGRIEGVGAVVVPRSGGDKRE